MELEEAAAFLNNRTENSLALIDELGRGTSTHDGAAIAGATIDYVASEIKCRCVFSTHYDFHVAQAENFRMVAMQAELRTLRLGVCEGRTCVRLSAIKLGFVRNSLQDSDS